MAQLNTMLASYSTTKEVKEEYGIEFKTLNIGGGFGIKYVESDDPVNYGEYIHHVAETINEICNKENIKKYN